MTSDARRFRPTATPLEDRLTPAGGLDPAFGVGGIVLSAPAGYGTRVAVASDAAGGILALGGSGAGGDSEVVRYLPDGTADAAFGTAGRVDPLPGRQGYLTQIAVGPGGKITLAGTDMGPNNSYVDLTHVVVRLNPDGSPDATFGVGGRVVLPIYSEAERLAVRPDGSVVVAARAFMPSWGYAVTQLTPAGSLDPAFGAGGQVFLATPAGPGYGMAQVNEIALTPAGGLLVLGSSMDYSVSYDPTSPLAYSTSTYVERTALYRLTPAGALDATFSGDGVWVAGEEGGPLTSIGGGAHALAVQPDGKIVLTGGVPVPGGQYGEANLVAVRLAADGSVDTSFGTGGVAVALSDGGWVGYASVALLPDGRVVVGSSRYGTHAAAVAVLNPDGTPDDYFADGSGVGNIVHEANEQWGRGTGVGDIAVVGDRIVVASSLYGGYSADPFAPLLSRLGLAVLAERPDALPPDHLTPPPIPQPPEPPVDPETGGGYICGLPIWTATLEGGWGGGEPLLCTGGPLPMFGGGELIDVAPGDGSNLCTLPPADPAPMFPLTLTTADPQPGTPVPAAAPPAEVGTAAATASVPVPVAAPAATPVPVAPRVAGDLDGDGTADRVLADGRTVSVLSGRDGHALVAAFAPFEAAYTGTLNALLADVDGDGRAELVVSPDAGGGPVVAVYSADGTQLARFWGIEDTDFRGGARVAAGDLNGDGADDLTVAAGAGGGPRVAVFDGRTLAGTPGRLVADFFAFADAERGGVNVAAGDTNGDGVPDLAFGGGPGVLALSGRDLIAGRRTELVNDPVGDPAGRGGVQVGVAGGILTATPPGGPAKSFLGSRPARTASIDEVAFNGAFVG